MVKHRWLTGAVIAAAAIALPVGVASAQDDDSLQEAYPPSAAGGTVDPVDPADPGKLPATGNEGTDTWLKADPGKLPATGNEGTDTWLKVGAGGILVGGILVAAAARRRQPSKSAPGWRMG